MTEVVQTGARARSSTMCDMKLGASTAGTLSLCISFSLSLARARFLSVFADSLYRWLDTGGAFPPGSVSQLERLMLGQDGSARSMRSGTDLVQAASAKLRPGRISLALFWSVSLCLCLCLCLCLSDSLSDSLSLSL